jgi:hypothetical protein
LDLKGRKADHGENYIMMNFIACILHLILLGLNIPQIMDNAQCNYAVKISQLTGILLLAMHQVEL